MTGEKSRLNKRSLIVYVASGVIVLIVLLSGYFFVKKPQRATSNLPEEAKKVMIFRDVKYSGERNGLVDWEVRARLVRQFIDKGQIVEMEGIEGEYKPRSGTIVSFKGARGEMDREKQMGTVQDVEVHYKGEYVIKSSLMNFDFGKSLAYTQSPVDLKGDKITMVGVGLDANTREQRITVERDVSGALQSERQRIRFSADKFTYLMKDGTYILSGKVVVKGEQMDMVCDKVTILSSGDDIEKVDAVGGVRIVAKGAIAKTGHAVYYLKDDKVVLEQDPHVVREGAEIAGETIVYNLKTDKFSVDKPKMRIEQRPR
jgi:lipopolysaccharide transport protein LptA/LPS export ABC transporter protein LptC